MLLCMGIIFFLSNQQSDDLNAFNFPGLDKVAHIVIYAVLSWTVIISYSERLRRSRKWLVFASAVALPILFGISDEYHQSYVVGRSSEFLDLVADGFGALLVSTVWFRKTS